MYRKKKILELAKKTRNKIIRLSVHIKSSRFIFSFNLIFHFASYRVFSSALNEAAGSCQRPQQIKFNILKENSVALKLKK